MLRTLLSIVSCLALFTVITASCDPQVAAADEGTTTSLISMSDSMLTIAQQNDDGGGVRVRGRSIRGIIFLALAVISGIGWLVKKLLNRDE